MAKADFLVGCNYWASHAGTMMWRDFRADVVRQDLVRLHAAGVRVVRLFPLWSDFQPLNLLRGWGGNPAQYRFGEQLLGDDPVSRSGVDQTMLDRFAAVADIAGEVGIKLIVGLLTGWMSGRFFAPPALEHLNAITDPESLRWQVRFVRTFVGRFKDHPSILAWELGNECNCMGIASRAQAWAWTHAISSAIRCEDAGRPVYSGMHSLVAGSAGPWTITDQAELTDMLCTHPYPAFTPACDLDSLASFRPAHHAAAESCLYADLGGKPCLVEEIGALGDEFGNQQTVADYVRMALYTSWAFSTTGFLWWCAFDQLHLTHAPYDWNAVERELGLLHVDGSPKLLAGELKAFTAFLDALPFGQIPPRRRHAVCVLTDSQDHWKVAYATFLLARQASFDLQFCYHDQPLPEAPLYLVPSYSSLAPISRHTLLELQNRVARGATLYLSHQDGAISLFRDLTGMEVVARSHSTESAEFVVPGGEHAVSVPSPVRQQLRPAGAEVLSVDQHGNPVLSRFRNGKGQVLFLGVPLESHLAGTPGAFANPAWHMVYRQIIKGLDLDRAVMSSSPLLGVTEHPADDGSRVIVQVNYSAKPIAPALPAAPWTISQWLTPQTAVVPPFGPVVYMIKR